MKRVTQGGDINFNVADVRGLGDNYAFRFYTTDSCKYIVKVDGDAVDDIIRLEWDELKTLGDGVLNYSGDNLEPDEEYSDATFNRTFGGTTQWYIVTSCSGGGSSEEISELSDRLDAEIQRSTDKDDELEAAIDKINEQNLPAITDDLMDITLNTYRKNETYSKTEVDQKIAEAEMGGELPESIVIDADYVHTDNNFTTNYKNKLDGIAAGAEVNVQADWNVTDTSSDAYIQHKPSIPQNTSDLTNDSNFVVDANYVHTDNNYTTDERTKLAGLSNYNDTALSNRVTATETALSNTYRKNETYSQSEVNNLIDGIEAGDTVVINTDGANIVDEHDNNSVLVAPSARQMKLMYENFMLVYNGLANIAFTEGKPNLNWIGSKTKYTLSYGNLSNCVSDVEAGQVEEGGLRITLTPFGPTYAFTSVTVNGNSIATTPKGDNLGSVYIDVVVNDDITVSATAESGYSVGLSSSSVNVSMDTVNVRVGGTFNGIITPDLHCDLPQSITATMGGVPVDFTASGNDYDYTDGSITIANVTGVVLITVIATLQSHITVNLPNDANIIIKHNEESLSGSVEVYSGMTPYAITFKPIDGYKFTTAPNVGGTNLPNIGNVYTLTVSASDTQGSNITVNAVAAEANQLTVTLPSDANLQVEDIFGNVLTGNQNVVEGDPFQFIVRCKNGYQFVSGSEPSVSGITPTIQSDGSYKFLIPAVNDNIACTATTEAITAFTVGDLNYKTLDDTTKAAVTLKSGTAGESTANTDGVYTGDIVVPANVSYCGASYAVTEIGNYAFWKCFNVTSASLPEGLTKIGVRAFGQCYSMVSVNYPSTLTSLGDTSFANCTGLTEIDLTNCDNLTIGNNAFRMNYGGWATGGKNSQCTSIRFKDGGRYTSISGQGGWIGALGITELTLNFNLVIPSNSLYHFAWNSKLETVIITKDYDGIGDRDLANSMFFSCNNIKDVYVYKNTPPICWYGNSDTYRPFNDAVMQTATLHIPTTATLEDWTGSSYAWSHFVNIVQDLTIE